MLNYQRVSLNILVTCTVASGWTCAFRISSGYWMCIPSCDIDEVEKHWNNQIIHASSIHIFLGVKSHPT